MDFQEHHYLSISLEFNLLLSLPSLTPKQEANTTVSWEVFFFFIKAALFDYQRIITLRIRPTVVCVGFHWKKNPVSMLFILASLWKIYLCFHITFFFLFLKLRGERENLNQERKKADTWPHYSCLRRGKRYDITKQYFKRLVRWRQL